MCTNEETLLRYGSNQNIRTKTQYIRQWWCKAQIWFPISSCLTFAIRQKYGGMALKGQGRQREGEKKQEYVGKFRKASYMVSVDSTFFFKLIFLEEIMTTCFQYDIMKSILYAIPWYKFLKVIGHYHVSFIFAVQPIKIIFLLLNVWIDVTAAVLHQPHPSLWGLTHRSTG